MKQKIFIVVILLLLLSVAVKLFNLYGPDFFDREKREREELQQLMKQQERIIEQLSDELRKQQK